MSYRDPERGYKGMNYGIGAMAVAGLFYLARLTSVTSDMQHGEAALKTPEAVERKLLADTRSGTLYATIQRTYPDDFNALTTQIANNARDGQSAAAIAASTRSFLAVAQQNHRAAFAQAPHDALAAYRSAEIAMLGDLRSTDSRLCASYVVKGTTEPGTGSYNLVNELQQRAWEAAAAGRDTPAHRVVARPAAPVWRAVADTMVTYGVSRSQLVAFFDQKPAGAPSPAEQCAAGLAFLRAVDELPDRDADQLYGYLISHG